MLLFPNTLSSMLYFAFAPPPDLHRGNAETPKVSGDDFTDEGLEEVFATFDKDGNATIEKDEMESFVKAYGG